jgi:hypothetical protein
VSRHRRREALLARGSRCAHGGEDAAARGVQLLVVGTAGTERELVDAIAAEGGMRVAVDKPGNGAQPASVDLDDVTLDPGEPAHRPDRLDRVAVAQDVRVVDPVQVRQRAAAERRVQSRRAHHLREVADQQLRHGYSDATLGRSRPCSRAAASASS